METKGNSEEIAERRSGGDRISPENLKKFSRSGMKFPKNTLRLIFRGFSISAPGPPGWKRRLYGRLGSPPLQTKLFRGITPFGQSFDPGLQMGDFQVLFRFVFLHPKIQVIHGNVDGRDGITERMKLPEDLFKHFVHGNELVNHLNLCSPSFHLAQATK
ncbi:MAG: hypothetical protein ACLQSR_11670 [Limisphaerales bacterium]